MSVVSEKLAAAVFFFIGSIWNPVHQNHQNDTAIQRYWSDLRKELNADGKMVFFKHGTAEDSDKSIL